MPAPLETLPRTITVSSILPCLASGDWLRLRAASRSCHSIFHEEGEEADALWRAALVRDYRFVDGGTDGDLRQTLRCRVEGEDGGAFLSTGDVFTAPTSFVSWKHWRKIDLRLHRHRSSIETLHSWEKLVGPYFLRAAAMWRKIEEWCDDESKSGVVGSAIKASLLPGRPLDPGAQHARDDGPKFLSALQAVHAFYARQRPRPHMEDSFHHAGMFGGIQAYDFITSTRWSAPDFSGDSLPNHFVLAQGEGKMFAMEVATGQVYCFTGYHQGGEYATPRASASSYNPDSVLQWFEEHARRLNRNFYSVGILKRDDDFEYNSLLRYPTISDTENCSRAVTRGVEVLASAVFCPEIKTFVYSIRMRLLRPEDGEGYVSPEERGFATCQLVSRHWKVSKFSPDSDRPVMDEVRGDGVIGYYPLLHEGGYDSYYGSGPETIQNEGQGTGYFSYQSCTQPVPGSFEGYLQFVPRNLAEPNGEMFNVRVNPFPLELPDFLY